MSSEHLVPLRLARRHLVNWVCAVLGGHRGVASIEFGIITATIAVIILGTYDIGNYVLQDMKLADAAHAGGQYAISYPADTAGMTAAIDAVLPPAWSDVTVTPPAMTCGCWSAGSGEAVADCSASPVCPSGQTVERFITITLQRNYSPLLVTGLTSTSASYVARVQ